MDFSFIINKLSTGVPTPYSCPVGREFHTCRSLEVSSLMADNLDKKLGRFKLYLLTCYEKLDMLDNAIKILNGDFVVPDLREGEYSIYSVYVEVYKKIIKKQRNC